MKSVVSLFLMICLVVVVTGVRWRRSRIQSGGGAEEGERGHRGRNSELRRSISDMNLSLRRRQGNHVGNDPRRSGNHPNNSAGLQDRKNIVSMIAPLEHGEVRMCFNTYCNMIATGQPHLISAVQQSDHKDSSLCLR